MKKLFILFATFLLLNSCARLGYLTEQGIQQMKIQLKGVPNEKVLNDPSVPEKFKKKILLIEDYKKFFYEYFQEEGTSIYSKTTMLESEAVSYLVIASPHTRIEAHEFKFPFMGSFPYIGFFNKQSAIAFAEKLVEKEELVTWIRPVYAYSTLGYLEDRILSSFFEYDDIELAELIFHELFHTIFFIKDEVDLNENLANLYGKELMKEYFKGNSNLDLYMEKIKKKTKMNKRIVDLIGILQTELAKMGAFNTKEKANAMTQKFVEEVLKPELRALAKELELDEQDYKIDKKWNQAGFAAFLTYEEDQDFLSKLQKHYNFNLKEYLSWLRLEYKEFQKNKRFDSFTEFLKTKVPDAPLTTH